MLVTPLAALVKLLYIWLSWYRNWWLYFGRHTTSVS